MKARLLSVGAVVLALTLSALRLEIGVGQKIHHGGAVPGERF